MHQPLVTLETAPGETTQVGPGGIIGRMHSAALCIDDPRVSEAHAMVSLRGGRLQILALRGPVVFQGYRVSSKQLEVGQTFSLVRGLDLRVVDIDVPSEVVALQVDESEPVRLVESVYSLVATPEGLLRLEARHAGDAAGWVWASSETYRLRLADMEPEAVRVGCSWTIGEHRIQAVSRASVRASTPVTVASTLVGQSLRVVARFDTVHLHRADGPSAVLAGMSARIVSELAQFSSPVGWEVVAGEIWGQVPDRHLMRQNWDRNMRSLRANLRKAQIRENLVRPDGCGNVELYLTPGDELVDET